MISYGLTIVTSISIIEALYQEFKTEGNGPTLKT